MKKILGLVALMSLLAACNAMPEHSEQRTQIGMANPASTYCIEQKGKLEIRQDPHGQVGYCHLPSGEIVEEWTLFRAQQKQCLVEKAQILVGKPLPTIQVMQDLTQAQVVRVLSPDQAMTMDFREDRLTVWINPTTQIVEQVSCG